VELKPPINWLKQLWKIARIKKKSRQSTTISDKEVSKLFSINLILNITGKKNNQTCIAAAGNRIALAPNAHSYNKHLLPTDELNEYQSN